MDQTRQPRLVGRRRPSIEPEAVHVPTKRFRRAGAFAAAVLLLLPALRCGAAARVDGAQAAQPAPSAPAVRKTSPYAVVARQHAQAAASAPHPVVAPLALRHPHKSVSTGARR